MNTLQGKNCNLPVSRVALRPIRRPCLTRGLIKKGAEVQIVITPAGKGVHHSHHAFGADQQTGHQRVFSQRDGHMAQPRGLGIVGRRHGHCPGYGCYHRKRWHTGSRQHAGDDLPVDEGSGVCGSGHGPGYVCSSFYPA